MRKYLLSAVEFAFAIAAAYAIISLSLRPVDYRLAVEFLAAVFLLNLLDLSMPYGETMPVDSAMVVACLILAGPLTATLVTVVARIAVHLARYGTEEIDRAMSLLSRRMVAIAVSSVLVARIPSPVSAGLSAVYIQCLVAAFVFVALELSLAQLQAAPRLHEGFYQLMRGNLALQGPLLAAEVSVATLTVITYRYPLPHGLGVWALVVMSLLMVLMRQSLALLLAIRQAYRATIEALVAAIEAQDPRRRGHAERVESLARSIAVEMRIRGRALENVAYAALLHDVDMLGFDSDQDEESRLRHSGDTVSSVRFLSEVVPILHLCDGIASETRVSPAVEQSAAVVAVASDLDDEVNTGVADIHAAVDRVATAGVSANSIGAAQFAAASLQLGGGR